MIQRLYMLASLRVLNSRIFGKSKKSYPRVSYFYLYWSLNKTLLSIKLFIRSNIWNIMQWFKRNRPNKQHEILFLLKKSTRFELIILFRDTWWYEHTLTIFIWIDLICFRNHLSCLLINDFYFFRGFSLKCSAELLHSIFWVVRRKLSLEILFVECWLRENVIVWHDGLCSNNDSFSLSKNDKRVHSKFINAAKIPSVAKFKSLELNELWSFEI
jgi:hypothetical protein